MSRDNRAPYFMTDAERAEYYATHKPLIRMSRTDYLTHVHDSDGLCVACGALCTGGVEPDADGYECEECDEDCVMGFENALMDGWIEVTL